MIGRAFRAIAAAALFVTITAAPGFAQPVECGEYQGVVCQGWFTDDAGVVDDDQAVEDAIDRLVGRYGNQIAMVVVEDSRGQDPADFAFDLGNAWGVGTAGADDGVVVVVDLSARRTEMVYGPGVSLDADRITGAGNSFFGAGEFGFGMLAIVGSLEQGLEDFHGGATAPGGTTGDAVSPPVVTSPGTTQDDGSGFSGTVAAVLIGVAAAAGGIGWARSSQNKRNAVRAQRRELVDGDLTRLEPAGHELPLADDYKVVGDGPISTGTAEVAKALQAVAETTGGASDGALRAAWFHDLVVVLDVDRLLSDVELPIELRASQERPILEDAVQEAARDALAVSPGDNELFEVKRGDLQRLVDSLRPHRVAAARRRGGQALADRTTPTPVGPAMLTDLGERFLRTAGIFDADQPIEAAIEDLEAAYATAQSKTAKMESLYEKLPASTTRPAVAAALADVTDETSDAVSEYEKLRQRLEREGDTLKADGLAIPAIAALLLLNNDGEDVDDFLEIYRRNRNRGHEPDESVEYALAGISHPGDIKLVRREADRLGLPVSITVALLRRRDDGPEVYEQLLDELAAENVTGDTRRTIAGILAVSLEPAQTMRRWIAARQALATLGLQGAYADIAAAFGASDPRGPRAFALSYAAQRQALARSSIDDADRFAPELAHEGTRRQTDTYTGRPIPRGLFDFDPFTLLFYHWVITKGHGGSYGWEPIYRDNSWSQDRDSWWGGTGGFGGWGGGGFFGGGGGGSSWGGGGWGGGGGFGGFGGGGFGGGGGGGSSW